MLNLMTHGPVAEAVLSTSITRLGGLRVSAFRYRGFLIDTGFPRVANQFMAWVDSERVAGCIVTHFHEDHAGNLGLMAARGIPVAVSAATLRLHQALIRVPPYRWIFWGHPNVSRGQPVPAEHPFQLIPTPGHTADHVAVFDPDARVLFTGDLFLGVKACVAHSDESPAAMVTSLRTVVALEPKTVFDSHRGLLRDPVGALTAKADWIESITEAIRGADRAGKPDAVIVRELLGGEDRVATWSRGQLSKRNFVRAILSQ